MHCSKILKRVLSISTALLLAGCSLTDDSASAPERQVDGGILWVHSAAEFEALSLQAYRAATEDLDKFIADTSWSALPDQRDADELPMAIVADVDETIVSNVEFQMALEPPFVISDFYDWNDANKSRPIPGAAKFVTLAQQSGVEVFFVTNRPCEVTAGSADPCLQRQITLQDIVETGISTDLDHVMLSNERAEWDREKVVRRNHIAQTHRVIMLLGDDLGDFIPCTRRKALKPCTAGATVASRLADTKKYDHYWGEGWYVLPNPMHGSWTTVD